jgi:aldehyde:ferredoxin oxidoreductase
MQRQSAMCSFLPVRSIVIRFPGKHSMSKEIAGGYIGLIGRINLTHNAVELMKVPHRLCHQYIGGRGFVAYYLYTELKPWVKPLSPENMVAIFTGPLNGTLTPYTPKYVVGTLSPLTNTITRSLAGGLWAAELKYAGFDGLLIEGGSKSPVYLEVQNGKIRIQTAEDLWGLPNDQTESMLNSKLPENGWRVLSIGPAGEKQVPYACLMNDGGRAAGRGGVAAVLGNKNLKAIAVRGTGGVGVAESQGFRRVLSEAYDCIKKDPLAPNRIAYGTTGTVEATYKLGILPVMNYSRAELQGIERILAESMRTNLFAHDYACFGCPLACSKISYIRGGRYKGTWLHGPQFETIGLLGANCGITDPEIIARANALCNQLGLDTISTGNVIGFAMECYERGFLTRADTGGLELAFGNGDVLMELIPLIAYRKGLGDILALGTTEAAKRIGHGCETFAMASKSQSFASFIPRSLVGMGLLYATSPFGANHSTGPTLSGEIKVGTTTSKGKPELVKKNQDCYCLMDSMIFCSFSRYGLDDQLRRRFLENVTGREFDLSLIAERIFVLERLFNNRAGFDRRQDTLPLRSLNEPMPDGLAKGNVVPLEEMLEAYYTLRDWDKNGLPTRGCLERLGLSWTEDDLIGHGVPIT